MFPGVDAGAVGARGGRLGVEIPPAAVDPAGVHLVRRALYAQWRRLPARLVGDARDSLVDKLSKMVSDASLPHGSSSDVVLFGARGAGKTCAWR